MCRQWRILLLICIVALALAGCDQSDDDVVGAEVDDCGFSIVEVPEGCDKCHGAPPDTGRHPENHRCFRCHGMVIGQDMNFIQPALHRNGKVDVAVGCTSCHGWDQGASPPQNLSGECGETARNVGAHTAMRRDAIPAHQVNCSNCHVIPLRIWEMGHIDGDNVPEITFGMLATAHDAKPVWNGETCSGVYCHGGTLKGGWLTEPEWQDTSGKPSECGACHLIAGPDGDPEADCSSCHPTSISPERTILLRGTHINGHIDMAGEARKGGRP